VVLYELVAGCAPFERSTPSEVIALILEREPPPLARYARDVSPELERIVTKALTKDKEERYQTAKDLLVDLRRLRQRLEIEGRSATPVTGSEPAVTTDDTPPGAASTNESAARTRVEVARPTSSAEYLLSEIKRHKTVAIALATLIIAVAASVFGLYKFIGQSRPGTKPTPAFQTMKIARLTSTGKATSAAVSPDGKYVVHVMDDAGQQSLWMRQVETASNVQIVAPADVVYEGLTFSHDGNYVYYVEWDKKTLPALYKMPVLGGAVRRLVVDIDSAITFSPDDQQFAFLRGNTLGETALIVANSNGTSERKLAVRKEPDFFPTAGAPAPAWSLDGKVIACPAGRVDASGRHMTVVEVNVANGAVKAITQQRWWGVEFLAWLRDGSGVVLTAREQAFGPSQLWHLSYPGGEVQRVTNDLNDYRGMSLTADSTALVTVQSDQVSNISLAGAGNTNHATQLTSGECDGKEGISWTSDGKIVYASLASRNLDIWIMNQDGSNQKQLTAEAGNNRWPTVSADGRYIVFASDRVGALHIWRMNIDGSNSKQLTNGSGEGMPDCSPDGQWVVYNSLWRNFLWKVPIEGGEPVQVIDRMLDIPAISPDGKLLASFTYIPDGAGKVAIYPFAGGKPIRSFDIESIRFSPLVRWTPDGRALTYIDPRNLSNIRSQPIEGSPSKLLTDFKDGRIFNFAWSRDGKWLTLARGSVTNDVVLISGFREQK